MTDYYYPLPQDKLKNRYAPLFEIVRNRQSGSFVGLPKSAKSGYLQFLLQEGNIIKKIIPKWKTKSHILYFEPIPIITDNPYHWLFQLSIKLEILDKRYQHKDTEDPTIIFTNIQKYLIELYKNSEHLTIILSNPSVLSNLPIEAAQMLESFWNIRRQPPKNACSLIFLIHSQTPSSNNLSKFYRKLLHPLTENILYFPTLDKSETLFTIKRLSNYYKVELTSENQKQILTGSGGIYPVILQTIKLLQRLPEETYKSSLKYFKDNVEILKTFDEIYNSFDLNERSNLNKDSIKKTSCLVKLGIVNKDLKIISPWFREFVQENKFNNIPDKSNIDKILSGKEFIVYQLLNKNKNEVVTRDQIADVMWEEETAEKYSNWAIDKIISRIRKSFRNNNINLKITTIRGKGYMLIS